MSTPRDPDKERRRQENRDAWRERQGENASASTRLPVPPSKVFARARLSRARTLSARGLDLVEAIFDGNVSATNLDRLQAAKHAAAVAGDLRERKHRVAREYVLPAVSFLTGAVVEPPQPPALPGGVMSPQPRVGEGGDSNSGG